MWNGTGHLLNFEVFGLSASLPCKVCGKVLSLLQSGLEARLSMALLPHMTHIHVHSGARG